MRAPAAIAVLAALLCATSACDGSGKQIVGKWKTTGGASEAVWEFHENGALSVDGSPGRYSFGDNRRIKVQTKTATFVHQMELEGDRMTWTDPNGGKLEFRRVK
jgi:hypothetical protein